MKRIKILVATVVLSSLGFVSCSDFLDETPDNRTELNSKDKIAELLVTAYPERGMAAFAETYSDNVFDTGRPSVETITNGKNYRWEFDSDTGPETPSDYWDACYSAIAAANQALEAIDKLGNADGSLNGIRAEALLARAYAHFQLVSLWSKPYNPATADSDLGVPYVTEVEGVLVKKYKRASVAEVYKNIEADLEEGLKYITNDYKVSGYHFNVDAAKAFASTFYLSIGEWDKVLENTSYLGSKPAVGAYIRDMEALGELGLGDQYIDYGRSTHKTNLLMVTVNSYYFRDIADDVRFGLTYDGYQQVYANVNPFKKAWHISFGSMNNQVLMVMPKFWEYFKIENPTAGTGVGYLNYVLFSNDEAYLNRIEALVMSNRLDEAMTELSYYIGTRTTGYNPATDVLTLAKMKEFYPVVADEFTPFYSISDDQAVVLKGVLEAKRREFLHEGKRWLDIKRLNMEVVHTFKDAPAITLPKGDLRREIPLPLHAVADGLIDNPKN